jgi:hypothetical protein
MLKWAGDGENLTLVVTKTGKRRKEPSAIPGTDLTAAERSELQAHGWLHHKGVWYHPDAKRTGLWSRLTHPERYYDD